MGAKRKPPDEPILFRSENGSLNTMPGRRRSLILPAYLSREAQREDFARPEVGRSREIILKWADLEQRGRLAQTKETSLDAEFVREVFGEALSYRLQTDSPDGWDLERQFTVSGIGTADAAIGAFGPNQTARPVAVIELKGADADLDGDRFNGRTAVQQCWDYLSAVPGCPWGIVSNFICTRLFHRDRTPLAYEEFTLQELRSVDRFRQFYCLFEAGGLLKHALGQPPRALRLLEETGQRQREVGDELYAAYRRNRLWLVRYLHKERGKPLETAIKIAQRLIDRIVFIAFCEDRGLLKPRTIAQTYAAVPPFARVTNPRWRNFLDLFHAMDRGHRDLDVETGYDGGLFERDAEVDDLQLDDEWTDFFREVGEYDFRDEVNVDVLGHLFEKSITEIERLRLGGLWDEEGIGEAGGGRREKGGDGGEKEKGRGDGAGGRRGQPAGEGPNETPPAAGGARARTARQSGEEAREAAGADGGEATGTQGGESGPSEVEPKMPKSPKRKRFGIYYTPPALTRLIVRETVEALINERFDALARRLGAAPGAAPGAVPGADAKAALNAAPGAAPITAPNAAEAARDPANVEAYWRQSLAVLRDIKVCDPACGSGAFLIQAYDVLEEYYHTVLNGLADVRRAEAEKLAEQVSDMILSDNLFGMDLSPEAVEITQLSLWIRSARRGRTLADLSRNIIQGNSLVADETVDPHARDWRAAFPAVFSRDEAGFDCVIGNPPWERLKLQQREFFALTNPEIAEAVSAAERRRLIANLEKQNPDLNERYRRARQAADRMLDYARNSGQYPLTGKGDVNTYVLFAELARKLVAPHGCVGLLVPSGIATDDTTKDFFAALVDSQALSKLYDFENRKRIFPDVDGRLKFSILVFSGQARRHAKTDYVFFAHATEDLTEKKRHIVLTPADIALLNPNTRTCPIFRTRRDAKLTKAIYRRAPILIEHSRGDRGNPWGIRFFTMFHQTNDAELFHTAEQLAQSGFKRTGNRWTKRKEVFLPLYEAKMIQAYDHRAASVVVARENWMRQGQTVETSLVSHQQPEFVVQPRWWVAESEVVRSLGTPKAAAFLGFKDITSPTNERTMIASVIPWSAVTNHFPLIQTTASGRLAMCLLANLNAFALDYAVRQKIGGVTLNFFIVEQLPMFPPQEYQRRCPWNQRVTLERWISDRVLKLTCTSDDMRPLAEACGLKEPVYRWHPDERARLKAELDAAYFLLYGVSRDDAEYILSTFKGARRRDEADVGAFRTAELILQCYDELRPTALP